MRLTTTLTTMTLLVCTFFCVTDSNNISRLEKPAAVYDKKTRMDLASEQNFLMTKDAKTNSIPRERLWKTIEQLKMEQGYKGKAAIANIQWTERGPNNVGGRTRALLFDPNDSSGKGVYAGSVAGGLWYTSDIYASDPSWSPVDEFLENMAITTLAYDPSKPDTLYFGTGEGYYNSDAVRGDGIFRSTDGGSTWTQLANSTNYNYIQKIVVDASGNVYAATRGYGVVKSTDAGSSWAVSLNSTGTPSTNRVADLEIAANGDLYAAFGIFGGDGVYKSTNGGTSWTKVYTSSAEYRLELACAPSNSSVIYMVTHSSSSNDAKNVKKSTNGGSSWSNVSNPSDAVGGSNFCRGQAWYDISLVVDPNDATVVYMGGIDLYKTTNSGSSWTQVSHWYGGGGYPEVHADQHIALYAPNSSDSILFGNDGGIFRSLNATSSTPSFTHTVSGYNVTQFYSGAIHPTANENYFLAGAQDNGSHQFTSAGVNATNEVTGGDGAYVHIDQNDASYQFTSYVYNQFRRSTNSGSSFSNVNWSTSNGKFINPTDYDNDAYILYSSWNPRTYLRWTDPRSGTTASTVSFGTASTGEPSAISCDPNTANRIYIGTDDGEVWRINNANASASQTDVTPSGMSSSDYVSCIAVENGDANHLLVTVSNYGATSVYESTNGGSSWTNVEGNLPDMPVRWALFSPMGGDSALLATELGVWSTTNLNGGSTNWASSNTGLANVRTDMLQFRASDSTVIAVTHGRGLYTTSFSLNVAADFNADATVVYPCETVSFTDASINATSWAWDFNNDGITDATTQNPTWTYHEGGLKTVSLTINGTETTTKTDYMNVLPKLGTPYTLANGGNFESNTWHFGSKVVSGSTNIWELGAPSNAISNTASGTNVWKTDLDSDITSGDYTCALYTPSFNFSASGTYGLSFSYRMEAQYYNAPIAVWVEYSTNGSSWSRLGNQNTSNNWYSTTLSDVSPDGVAWSHNKTSYTTATQDVSSLAGNSDVRFRVMFMVETGWGGGYTVDGFSIDNFALSGPSNDPHVEIETALNASSTAYLGPNATVNFYSDNCKLIATIENLGTHDYGATTVVIDNAGSSARNIASQTAASKRIMDKSIRITPTTNNTSGNVKITTYYTGTEGTGWKGVTGWYYNDLVQMKSTGAMSSANGSNTVEGSSRVIDSAYLGSHIMLTSSYSNGFSGVGAGPGGSNGPLPVDLISFTGERLDGFSELKWVTASEVNSSRYELQRLNKEERFETIAWVDAKGNSNALLTYTYLDNDPAISHEPILFYRLKMIDQDGSSKVSQIVRLKMNDAEVRITVYPIPTSDELTIETESQSGKIGLDLFALNGQLAMSKDGIHEVEVLSLHELTPGIYFLQIRSNAHILQRKKIIISR